MQNAPAPVRETERLILRLPRLEDCVRYAEPRADEVALRSVGGHLPRSAAWLEYLRMSGAWAVQGVAMLSLIGKSSGPVRLPPRAHEIAVELRGQTRAQWQAAGATRA
ncbi:hypothetical protein LU699_16255 [Luteimonas fraxinea]|uniref:Uncharacterized protein n=1 Tax=Luteimonas fraxinea TaxID=2901869 RepID=A0ABS8UEB9_9GAMM|nr:hypothetical protein [Luteimonas fraxinea]MCD9096865.1 hypothetical protein [Luteimonas fraxinea]MCD9126820.1 hypothetical protein [Luteimonas fraxinea]UHH09789.1 hypothetical protein LU699_16255 [Luteimonas fraxinea]